MMGKKNLEPPYDSFGKSLQISVYNNLNTTVDFDSTSFVTLGLDLDSAHGSKVQLDTQSEI
jgi:hypothetical protein